MIPLANSFAILITAFVSRALDRSLCNPKIDLAHSDSDSILPIFRPWRPSWSRKRLSDAGELLRALVTVAKGLPIAVMKHPPSNNPDRSW